MLLQRIGLPTIGWLTDRRFAMPAIAIMATWKNVGLYVVLFLVGLQAIPAHCTKRRNSTARARGKSFV